MDDGWMETNITTLQTTHNKTLRGNIREKPPGTLGELEAKGDQNGGEGGGAKEQHRKNDPEGWT
jgi:hypothetical protein